MLKLKVFLFLLPIFQSLYSQTLTVSGYVEDINTGERIIDAYVKDTISKNAVQTNSYGFYTIKCNKGKVALQSTFIGLKSEVILLSLKHDTLINIQMKPIMELQEVIIESSVYKHNTNTPLGLTIIPIKQLTSVPALGESDLLKSIQSQPGIKGGIEGSAGIFVRGGSSGENLFMLDDVPMYNVSHLYGFLSVFNSAIIKDIKLMKGCFPARYGGRTSSVIDVRSRDGNNKSLKGEISVGIISSSINLEGPLFNDKTTFIISGRRSYFDLYSGILKNLGQLDQDFPGYYFYDLSARIAHTFSQNDKVYLNIYRGRDHIRNNSESTIMKGVSEILTENFNETSGWGNLISSLRWNHNFSSGIFANTTIAVSSYDYFTLNKYKGTLIDSLLDETLNKNYKASYKSTISDLIIKTDFDYSLSNAHKLLFGAGSTIHTFSPGESYYSMNDEELKEKLDTSYLNTVIHASEFYLYTEDQIKTTQKLMIDIGLRLTGFIADSKGYFNPEPRVTGNFSFSPKLVFKIGYSRMVQYLHLLSTSGLTMPTDIWVPALDGLKPLKSDQINAGFSYDWHGVALLTVEAYRKWLNNTTDFKNGASLLSDTSPWHEKTTQGYGNAKGIEVSVKKQQGHLTGSINYTLSTSDRKYSDLNYGNVFPFRYHRLHDFNISINFIISKKWDVSALWTYGTGYPVTVPVEQYTPAMQIVHNLVYHYPSINNYRLPDYHRLDLGVHYRTLNRLGENHLSFDIFNAYNRKNVINMYAYGPYFKYSYLLPFIPSVTYTLKLK
jgi:outer membrane receptor for ferrienterochelin and colicin